MSSPSPSIETFNYETRITLQGQTGRIKILPANPRTARGFSGDLILDEFAFHENSAAIWEAAEPILSANPDYLCRIASTPNGRYNMFYRLITDPSIPKRIVPRSEAWKQGLTIYHPVTREPVTPDQARTLALDKNAYDQNYECIFHAENLALLTSDLISAAEDPAAGVICDGAWCPEALTFFTAETRRSQRPEGENEFNSASPASPWSPQSTSLPRSLYIGVDVGRSQDLTVITVLEKQANLCFIRAMLRLRNLRLPEQQALLEIACKAPGFNAALIDMTGLGLGLFEYTQQRFGSKIRGLNFASSLELGSLAFGAGTGAPSSLHAPRQKARAPEVLALRLLQIYENKQIRHPLDQLLRDDLRKPERVTASDGTVSIISERGPDGHADHFWSLALAVHAAQTPAPAFLHVPLRFSRNRTERRFLV